MLDDASERWAINERKGRGVLTPRLPFHYLIFFIPSPTRKLHFLDNILQLNWMRNTDCCSSVITCIVQTRTVYMCIVGSQRFPNKQGIHEFECCYFLNGSFHGLANPLCF